LNDPAEIALDLLIIALFLTGIGLFRSPHRAVRGNLLAATAFVLAATLTWFRYELVLPLFLLTVVAGGALLGGWAAAKARMIHIPSMVALQNGSGGLAALLISIIELSRNGVFPSLSVASSSGLLGVFLGGITVSGSLVACLKLSNRFPPQVGGLPGTVTNGVLSVVLAGFFLLSPEPWLPVWARLTGLSLLAIGWGLLISIRVGGADMPVLISFLNATSGLAAGFCGIVIDSRLLAAAGAMVAASGTVLTLAMCTAMNRNLLSVLGGLATPSQDPSEAWGVDFSASSQASPGATSPSSPQAVGEPAVSATRDPLDEAVEICTDAKTVVIIPGYGMAMAQAQFEVVELGRLLERSGKNVWYAVHPVAGRMPGHMHVLLAEAEVPYDRLCDLVDANLRLEGADLAIIVGASDVVNPAAASLKDTPISGMPILKAHQARTVLVCNLDDSPGYSGVANQLYTLPITRFLWGDAREVVRRLIDRYSESV
jgi:H+-translocating NAD(P) transhydrogenase subunit beta